MLENIEIIDYKCFKDFKLNGLGQINIISGGNNVGKTALLEVLLLITKTTDIRIFIQILTYIFKNRDLPVEDIDIYLENINLSFKYNDKNINIKHKYIEDLNDEELNEVGKYRGNSEEFLVMSINDKLQIIPFIKQNTFNTPFRREKVDITFINSSKPNNLKLTELYSNIQDLNIQNEFLKYLQIIDKNIIGIEPQLKGREKSYLRITLDNPKKSLLSSELGEGTNRFIEILTSLLKSKNDVVFIDEIENGIHYSKLKDIFKAIIEIVLKEDIQLFITTHDSETIEALVEASKELNYKDITSIYLYNKDEKVEATIRDSENLIYGINRGADIR